MCKLLILSQHSSSFKRHLSAKAKADQIIEFKKINKSFGGEYVSRNGISLDAKYDMAVVIEYPTQEKADQCIAAVIASDFISGCKIFKLTTLQTVEQNYIDIGKVLNFNNKKEESNA
tara:strand:- start:152 stop:502 length:351 start_codon:yes stop_codon:yes gene_type:complete